MMTTLNEILSIPQFKGLELINRKGDLSSEVTSLDITENNDIKHFTSSNAFILTTGVLFQDNQENLKKLIKDLSDIQTAGLGIKVSRFLHKIDQDVIDFADELQFPLIEIPESWNLGEITHEISSFISDSETGKLNYALQVQQELNQLLIKGFSIDNMIERMSKLLGVPIILFNPFKKPEAISHHYRQSQSLLSEHVAYFNAHQQEELTQDKNNLVFENKDHVIFKVLGYTYFPYYIMVSQVNKLSYPFSLLTIEQVVSVLSFALYKNTKIQEVEKNDINRFFESLVYNKSDQALSIKKHADLLRQYYIYPSDYYQTIICGIDAKTNLENSYYLNELHQLTFQWLTDKLSEIDSYISVYRLPSNDRFVILIQNKQEDHLEMIERLQISYNDYFEDQISFGIGNEVTEFSQLPSSFFEASEAFENGLFNNEKSFISQYHSKDIQELLQLIPQEKLLPFVKHTLGPLSYPKTKKDIELKQTLKIYMDNQCDITKTAEKIFIHRNTVKYRINKCSNLIGTNIEDPIQSLNIRIAIYASNMIPFE